MWGGKKNSPSSPTFLQIFRMRTWKRLEKILSCALRAGGRQVSLIRLSSCVKTVKPVSRPVAPRIWRAQLRSPRSFVAPPRPPNDGRRGLGHRARGVRRDLHRGEVLRRGVHLRRGHGDRRAAHQGRHRQLARRPRAQHGRVRGRQVRRPQGEAHAREAPRRGRGPESEARGRRHQSRAGQRRCASLRPRARSHVAPPSRLARRQNTRARVLRRNPTFRRSFSPVLALALPSSVSHR